LDGALYFDKGDSVYVVVTVNDGIQDGVALSSIPMVVGNTPPSDLVVAINANSGRYNDSTLSCSASADDIDTTDTLTYSYTWSTGDTGETITLDGTLSPGAEVTCTAIASDGTDSITEMSSIFLENRAPTVDSLSLSPSEPTALTTEVTCHATASDVDGESVTMSYEWSVDGSIQSETGATLVGTFLYNQNIECTVTPTDALESGTPFSDDVTVINTVPVVGSVILGPTSVYTNDTLTATTEITDVDAAQSTAATYEWHVIDASDGNVDRVVAVTTDSLSGADPTQYFGRGDEVYVVVTPNDGVDDGLPMISSSVIILNSVPTTPTIVLEGSSTIPFSFTDDLICSVDIPAEDADPEDSITYDFEWIRNSGVIAQELRETSDIEDTLDSSIVSGGDWTCEVTASDGSNSSSTVSDTITVEFNTDMDRRTELLECVVEAGGCDVVLSAIDNSSSLFHNYIMPGSYATAIGTTYAGQTLCIPSGTYNGLYIYGLQGTPTAPVEVTNCGQGQVIIDGNGSGAITADDSQYLKLTGTGDPDQMYGFFVSNAGTGRDGIRIKGDEVGVTDIEVEYFEIEGPAYSGITISNYPYCNPNLDRSEFTQENTLVHHNYIHDIRNEQGENGGEGMYIGTSHYFMDESPTSANCTTPYQGPSLRGVQVYHNIVESTGRDGIQVGAAIEGMAIHHNTVRDYALAENFGHIGGIQVNPGSVGYVYANTIEGDPSISDNAIQVAGGEDGPLYIYNNVISGSALPLGFLTNMGNESSPVYVHNNTFINGGTSSKTLYLNCSFDGSGTIQNFYITNNIFTNYDTIGQYIYTDSNGGVWSKYYTDLGCPINGTTYTNDLDENLMLSNNLYEQDPTLLDFMDYSGGDYRLNASSPAIGIGEDLSSIFTDDFDGTDRGSGVPFDMGAFHYQ